MRGRHAHALPTVWVQTKVCIGLHNGRFAPWVQRGNSIHTLCRRGGRVMRRQSGRFAVFSEVNDVLAKKKGVRSMDALVAEMSSSIWRSPQMGEHHHRVVHYQGLKPCALPTSLLPTTGIFGPSPSACPTTHVCTVKNATDRRFGALVMCLLTVVPNDM